VTNSAVGGIASTARGKRTLLVAAASELVYRQGVERTTLADIAQAADMRVGNVYYYFKTKDDIIAAVVRAHVDQLEAAFAALEGGHRSPRARLKALVGIVAGQGGPIAEFGCPYGTLCSELVKRADGVEPLAGQLMRVLLGWVERQFRSMGRRDARELAAEFVAAYQGSAVVTSALGEPDFMARQARRLERWIDALATTTDGLSKTTRREGLTPS
jgi:TetR/AcrR family transcriptional regulator, transcriptional repressor for nem operon